MYSKYIRIPNITSNETWLKQQLRCHLGYQFFNLSENVKEDNSDNKSEIIGAFS